MNILPEEVLAIIALFSLPCCEFCNEPFLPQQYNFNIWSQAVFNWRSPTTRIYKLCGPCFAGVDSPHNFFAHPETWPLPTLESRTRINTYRVLPNSWKMKCNHCIFRPECRCRMTCCGCAEYRRGRAGLWVGHAETRRWLCNACKRAVYNPKRKTRKGPFRLLIK